MPRTTHEKHSIKPHSPEGRAIAKARETRESFSRAQSVASDLLTTELKAGNRDGLTLGELVRRLGAYGFSEHLASQALDAMRGRSLLVSSVGRISLRDKE